MRGRYYRENAQACSTRGRQCTSCVRVSYTHQGTFAFRISSPDGEIVVRQGAKIWTPRSPLVASCEKMMSRSTVARPNFSLTKSLVLKRAPGRISCYTAPLATPTSSLGSPVFPYKKIYEAVFFMGGILPRVEKPRNDARERKSLFFFWGGGYVVESV